MVKNLFIVLLLIMLVAVGYYAWFRAVPAEETANTPTGQNEPDDNGIPLNWKTFSSKELDFSFRYPPDWTAREIEPGTVALLSETGQDPESAPVIVNASGELPYARAVEEVRSNVLGMSERLAQAGKLKGVEISGNLKEELRQPNASFSIFTMLDNGGRLVSMDYTEFGPKSEEIRGIYRLIISSFAETGNAI